MIFSKMLLSSRDLGKQKYQFPSIFRCHIDRNSKNYPTARNNTYGPVELDSDGDCIDFHLHIKRGLK